MCAALGSEPVESEIPVEFDDLPELIQQAIEIYTFLPDRWEGMSATFMGKDYTIVFDLFKTFKIKNASEKKLFLRFMSTMDAVRGTIISKKQEQKKSS